LDDHRLQILASVCTRLVLGAYPLAFLLVFGWAFGKQAFDTAAAASNWANYLNVFLLSGFVLVPPAVARLRAARAQGDDRADVRDHVALLRGLLAVGAIAAMVLWAVVDRAFPVLAASSGGALEAWYPLLAILALSQLPLTLWLGVAQATGRYRAALLWIALPRAASLLLMASGAWAGAGPSATIAASVAIVVVGQVMLARTARKALAYIDRDVLQEAGRAGAVLFKNVSAGAIGLVGTLVTIVPVTLVGRFLPAEVGYAHVVVTLSNAVGAVIVAAFFPISLTLAERAREPDGLRRYSLYVARSVAIIGGLIIVVGWLVYATCAGTSGACSASLFGVGSLVVLGAGMRLGSLGVYHGAVLRGRPHLSLLSAVGEAIVVNLCTLLLIDDLGLMAIGVAFIAGGAVRLTTALTLELPLVEETRR